MRILKWATALRRHERGNAIAMFAATLPLFIGAGAISVDTIQVSLARRQLQRAADSAVLAGAHALAQGMSVTTAVNHDLGFNNDVPLAGPPTIENAPGAGPYAGNNRAVRVVLAAQRAVPFFAFFSGAPMTVNVEATAHLVQQGQYCAIALEDGDITGISMGGNADVNLGCGMATNSRAASAIIATGSSTINVTSVAAVGGVPPSGNYNGSVNYLPYSETQLDPLAGLPDPVIPTNCQNQLNVNPNASLTISEVASGIYCYRGMDIKGTLVLPPGVYYIDGGELSFGSQAHVTGSNVTFILTSSNAVSNPNSIAQLNINGGAELELTAPTSGIYANVLFYQDRRSPFGTTHINGNSGSRLRGALYFRNRELMFNGTSGVATDCLVLVARRLDFRGNTDIINSCPVGTAGSTFEIRFVRLVG